MWVFALGSCGPSGWLLSTCSNGELICWDLADTVVQTKARSYDQVSPQGAHVRSESINAHSNPVYAVHGVPGGTVFTGSDEEIRIWREPWNCGGGKAIGELRIPQLEGSRGSLSPLAETNGLTSLNKGQTLAAAAGDGNAYCWDVATQVLTHCFSGHKDYLHSIVSLERNGLIATGSEDGTCKFWDVREKKENQCVATLESGDIVSALSVSNDGNWLVMGGSSNGMGNFNMCHVASRVITDGRKCKHNTRVQSMTFTDKALVLGGDGQNLEYWSMNGSEYIVDVPTSSSSVFGLHYDSSAGILVSGGSSAFIDVFSEERSHMVSLQA